MSIISDKYKELHKIDSEMKCLETEFTNLCEELKYLYPDYLKEFFNDKEYYFKDNESYFHMGKFKYSGLYGKELSKDELKARSPNWYLSLYFDFIDGFWDNLGCLSSKGFALTEPGNIVVYADIPYETPKFAGPLTQITKEEYESKYKEDLEKYTHYTTDAIAYDCTHTELHIGDYVYTASNDIGEITMITPNRIFINNSSVGNIAKKSKKVSKHTFDAD